ncbi:unnamed protein product [marine sediment metagenome]|uniref:Uncharacterized protein n=1 Tax=marine sediment metagenome TaxID=412755 RepID=X1LT26_9ZZZZ
MGQTLLTPEELEAVADRIEKVVGIPPNPIRYVTIEEVAKTQLKKVMTDAPWKIGIGIRFLSEEEYQDLLKEAEVEE